MSDKELLKASTLVALENQFWGFPAHSSEVRMEYRVSSGAWGLWV